MAGIKIKITSRERDREYTGGKAVFAFFYLVVMFASFNTGNNLIYLVLATLTAVLVISIFTSRMSLRALDTHVILPAELYAGEETTVEFVLKKHRSHQPGRSLTLSIAGKTDILSHEPYVDVIPPNTTQRIQGIFRFMRRGVHPGLKISVTSNYPFGLFTSRKLYPLQDSLTVFPHIVSMESLVKTGAEGMHTLDAIFRGTGGGLLNIREFLPGDDYRHLHWKASAKRGNLMVKEFARERGQTIRVHLNPFVRTETNQADKDLFESAVSIAASIIYHCRAAQLKVVFSSSSKVFAPDGDNRTYLKIMRFLSGLEPSRRRSYTGDQAVITRPDDLPVIIDPLDQGGWPADSIVLGSNYLKTIAEDAT